MTKIKDILKERILVHDGVLGNMILEYSLSDSYFRGVEFKDFNINIKGCNDILSITQPDKIKQIQIKYLKAGSDIIETNTFTST